MLQFHPLQERQAAPERMRDLLLEFRALLERDGMADMDEYGDMLKWALPSRDGWCRYFHVFHPGYCSFSDAFYGTIHTHGGTIRGTVLVGAMDHFTYDSAPDADGDRFHQSQAYRLTRHASHQPAGTAYELPAHVPHWLAPTELTVTYFEEEDNAEMGELVNPASDATDEFLWEQEDADALLPSLLGALDRALESDELEHCMATPAP